MSPAPLVTWWQRWDLTRFPTQAQIRSVAMIDQDAAHIPGQQELADAQLILQRKRLILRNQQLGLMLQQLSACCPGM